MRKNYDDLRLKKIMELPTWAYEVDYRSNKNILKISEYNNIDEVIKF